MEDPEAISRGLSRCVCVCVVVNGDREHLTAGEIWTKVMKPPTGGKPS